MSVTVDNSGSVGSQAGLQCQNGNSFFSWGWLPKHFGGSSKSLDRTSSSLSAESLSENSCKSTPASSTSSSFKGSNSSSQNYSRSSSACSTDVGFGKKSVADKSEMKRVFDKFDANKDGKICGKDLHRFMGMSLEEAKFMLKSVNHNPDGCVDFEEFYSLYLSLTGDVRETDEGALEEEVEEEEEDETLHQVFQVFDRNGDGVITPQELQEVLNQLGIPEGKDLSNCKQMIQRVDSNGDERIDITEFKTMMRSSCFQG